MHGHGPAPKASIVAGNQNGNQNAYTSPAVVGRVGSALSPSSPSQSLLAHVMKKEGKINTLISHVFESNSVS